MQYLRDNAGVLEASANGTTWEAVVLGEGGGGVSDHTLLTNIGTNTHAQIDTHIADTGIHGGVGMPDEIDSPYTVGSLMFQDNSGVFEISADDGFTWEAVGGEGGGGGQTITVIDAENTTFLLSEIDGRLVILREGYDAALPNISTETGYKLITFNAQGNNSKVFPNASNYITLISGGGSPGQGIDLALGATIQLCGHQAQWFEVLSLGTITLIV